MALLIERECFNESVSNINNNESKYNYDYDSNSFYKNIEIDRSNYISSPERSMNLKNKLLKEMCNFTNKTQHELDNIHKLKTGKINKNIITLRNETYASNAFLKKIF